MRINELLRIKNRTRSCNQRFYFSAMSCRIAQNSNRTNDVGRMSKLYGKYMIGYNHLAFIILLEVLSHDL